jgi:hypothetical protein
VSGPGLKQDCAGVLPDQACAIEGAAPVAALFPRAWYPAPVRCPQLPEMPPVHLPSAGSEAGVPAAHLALEEGSASCSGSDGMLLDMGGATSSAASNSVGGDQSSSDEWQARHPNPFNPPCACNAAEHACVLILSWWHACCGITVACAAYPRIA